MIEKNVNVNKKHVKRLLEIDDSSKRVTIMDNRYYTRHDKYYPSVTSILQYMPKNKFFETWLKDVGHNAEFIAKKSADEGTQTHSLIERYLNGEKINWLDDKDQANCSLNVWQMLLKFVDFWETEKPELIESEIHLFSDTHKVAGTCDLVVKLRGELWLLDIKTSNNLHTSYDLQLSAYTTCWNETFEEKIENTGVIWLKSSKRKKDEDKFVGQGWEIVFPDKPVDDYFKMFMNIYEIYLLENPYQKPLFESYPTSVKLI